VAAVRTGLVTDVEAVRLRRLNLGAGISYRLGRAFAAFVLLSAVFRFLVARHGPCLTTSMTSRPPQPSSSVGPGPTRGGVAATPDHSTQQQARHWTTRCTSGAARDTYDGVVMGVESPAVGSSAVDTMHVRVAITDVTPSNGQMIDTR